MEHAGRSGQIGQPVELSPPFPQPPHPSLRGRDGERDQQHEPREAHRDVRPLGDVFHDERPGEELVEHQVREEMGAHVREREQPQHAAHLDQVVPPREPPHRRHGQGDHEEREAPRPGPMGDLLDGLGAQPVEQEVGPEQQEREQCQEKHGGFEHPPDEHGALHGGKR